MSEGSSLGELGGPPLLQAILQATQNAHIGVGVAFVDVEQPSMVYVNERVEELVGRPREEIARIGVWGCLAPETLADLQERHARALAHGEPRRSLFETTVLRPDGE